MSIFEKIIEYGKQKDAIAKEYKENKISHYQFCVLNEENDRNVERIF